MPTQSAPGAPSDVFSELSKRFPYVGLHHRLDQAASGLVLLTLDPSVNAAIARGFREHTIERTYLAVLVGSVDDTVWDRPVEGKAARTHVHVVGRGAGLSAVELRLETGRTHQIRQHAAMAGRPIAGDRRYGGEAGRRWPRLALHACRLAFIHPKAGAKITVESPIPSELSPLWGEAGA